MRGQNRAAETAKTLILVGILLYIIGDVILLLAGVIFLFAPFFGAFLLGAAAIGFVWIALIWVFSYDRVRNGDYAGARTPTLIFAILSLLSLGIIPGILFLIAYLKLEDAGREAVSPAAWSATPSPPLPSAPGGPAPVAGQRFCSHCGRANPSTGAFCQGCGAPLG